MAEPPSIEALGVFAEAAQDIVTAGLELAIGRLYACVDACNQAAEKAMQAVSVARTGHRAAYDHDLGALGATLEAPPDIRDALAALTPYHPEIFYAHTTPELADDAVTPEDAQDSIARARGVLRWARGIVVGQ